MRKLLQQKMFPSFLTAVRKVRWYGFLWKRVRRRSDSVPLPEAENKSFPFFERSLSITSPTDGKLLHACC